MSNYLKAVFFMLICLVILVNCKSENKPENILSEAEMTMLFLDIYETESILTSLDMGRDTTLAIFEEYEEFIFEKHNISEETYSNSLTYYYDHPKDLESIYETIIDSLTLRESKIKALEESKRHKRDSTLNLEQLK